MGERKEKGGKELVQARSVSNPPWNKSPVFSGTSGSGIDRADGEVPTWSGDMVDRTVLGWPKADIS